MSSLLLASPSSPAGLLTRGAVSNCHDRRCSTFPFVGAPRRAGASHRPLMLPPRTTGADASTADAAASAGTPATASALVDQVLELIKDSDGGDLVTPENRKTVDAALERLDAIGDAATLRPLDNPLIFGNYNVAYVSMGQRQSGQPAGGRFRSGLGKLLFATTALCQSVLPPDVVANKVGFRLFGFIPGAVGLRGRLVSIPEREGGPDNKDTVKVFFDPPVLSLPLGIHIRIGPPSTVVLKTTYVDERVRLGKGSRGSLFVFTRGGEADAAGMEEVGLQRTGSLGKFVLWAVVLAMLFNGGWLFSRPALAPVLRAAGLVQVLLATALGGIIYRGGIMEDPETNDDRPEVLRPSSSSGGGGTAAPSAA